MITKRSFFQALMGLLLCAASVSCTEDNELEKLQPNESGNWLTDIDPNQTWITSVPVRINIVGESGATVTARTVGNQKVTILGQKEMKGNGVMNIDVPQGIGTSFGLCYDDGSVQKQYCEVVLTGETKQEVDVDFVSHADNGALLTTRSVSTRAATNQSLYGNSYIPDCDYLNFGSWAWASISQALEEAKDPTIKHIAMIDYEIMSEGQLSSLGEFEAQETIYLSYLYGFTGQYSSRILGYYTYSQANFADIEYQDIAECLSLDYFNGKAKVQYQLDGKDKWYDANFDHMDADGLGLPKPTYGNAARRGDDAYNVLKVFEAYGDRISAIRGITFKLDIPAGKKFGFYLRDTGSLPASQKTQLLGLGMPEDRLPKNGMNFTNAVMNNPKEVKYRSALAIYDNFTFMGIDDNLDSGGDKDCNDVTFALSNVKGEKFRPKFTEETINSNLNSGVLEEHPDYANRPEVKDPNQQGEVTEEERKENLQAWTLCFEDGGTALDYDFNDVVLKVVPDTKKHTMSIWLLAAGGQRKTEVYYDGHYLGEVHQSFGVDSQVMVNTQDNGTKKDPVALTIDEYEWKEGYTMNNNLNLFTIKVYNPEGSAVHSIIHGGQTTNEEGKGEKIPMTLCIQGEWEWPLETVPVHTAYPEMGLWGKNVSDSNYWNWYTQSKPGHIVKNWLNSWIWWKK